MNELGAAIRAARKRKKMRPADLAAAIGYQERQVYRFETGRIVPKRPVLEAIERALGPLGQERAKRNGRTRVKS